MANASSIKPGVGPCGAGLPFPPTVPLKWSQSVVKHIMSLGGACFMSISSLRFIPFFHFHPMFMIASLLLYFLPAFLARKRSDFTAILLLNLLAGWTFIGWIIALVWALSSEQQRQVTVTAQPAAPPQPASGIGFFCSACGKSCEPGARFCSSCGAALPATSR
jgi:hypothetical protein